MQTHPLTPLFSFGKPVVRVCSVMHHVAKILTENISSILLPLSTQDFVSPVSSLDHLWESVWGSHYPHIHTSKTHPTQPTYRAPFLSKTCLKQIQLEISRRKMGLCTNIRICIPIQIRILNFLFYMVFCVASGFCCWNLGFSGFNFVFLLLSVWFGFC